MKKRHNLKMACWVFLLPVFLFIFINHALADETVDVFLKAKQFTYEEKWNDAIENFVEFLNKYPNSNVVDDAVFWLGYSLIKNGDNDCGIMVLNTFFLDEPFYWNENDSKLDCKRIPYIKYDKNDKSANVSILSPVKIFKGFDCDKVVYQYEEAIVNGIVIDSNKEDVKFDCARVVTEQERISGSRMEFKAKVTVTGSDCDEIAYTSESDTANSGDNSGKRKNLTVSCNQFVTANGNVAPQMDFILSQYADDALYYKGIAYMNKQDYDSGIAVFKRLVKSFNGSIWAPDALLRAMDYYLGISDYQDVLPVYETFMKRFPNDDRIEDIKTGYCVALQKLDRAGECESFIQKLKKKKDSYADSVGAEIIQYREYDITEQAETPAFIIPMCGNSYRIISPFGTRSAARRGESSKHKGIDFAAVYRQSVCSAADGVVIFAGQKAGYGNTVIIHHNNEFSTLYAHGSELKVKSGQIVHEGDEIMLAGSSGISTGNQLHFEVRRNGIAVDPADYLNE